MAYDRRPVRAPRLAGPALRALVVLAESPGVGALVRRQLTSRLGVGRLRALDLGDEAPLARPDTPDRGGEDGPSPEAALEAALALPRVACPYAALDDYAAAYRAGAASPEEVAERALAAVADDAAQEPPLRPLLAQHTDDVRRQASESAARWAAGAPLSPLDGAPVVIKDELHVTGYPTTLGTTFLGRGEVAREDATVVARLRARGALLVGKANLHELGLGVTGLNPHHGAARNPHDPARATGGSSSGSAVSVASGLAPVAIGCDGGGSIRIPAALCGVFGLKATYGRISEHGVPPLCWSVAHAGPLAASARDLAAAYAVVAGADPHDATSLRQPPPTLAGVEREDLTGVRVGVDAGWFEDADADVVARCRAAVDALVARGAEVREVAAPELDATRIAHALTITTEMVTAMAPWYPRLRRELGLDVRLNYAMAAGLRSTDYVHAQRLRGRVARAWDQVFEQVDLVATPATACTAPLHRARALATGESDLELLERLMRFAYPFNFTGHPAISIPVGHDAAGLPVGFQLVARPWEEALLLRGARLLEPEVERRPPARSLAPLPGATG